jgi:NAD+ synthase (glutamine-hydrolysing)
MKIALAQINPTVGDIIGNTQIIIDKIRSAKSVRSDLIVFPELAVCGYPPKDLLLRENFVDDCERAMNVIAYECHGITAIVGSVTKNKTTVGHRLHNTAVICSDDIQSFHYHKRLLPTYDVFDERRYFEPGKGSLCVPIFYGGECYRIGILICEDIWSGKAEIYQEDPVAETVAAGADMLVCISASPFCIRKPDVRKNLIQSYAKNYNLPVVFVNQVGGNDDLLFDGNSMIMWPSGNTRIVSSFKQDLMTVDLKNEKYSQPYENDDIEAVYNALVLGVKDYVRKCGFKDVIIGLSGGIDSALTAAIAVEALGHEKVHGVAMPSRYSSGHSVSDAELLAENLGIDFDIIHIEPAHVAFESMLSKSFKELEENVTEENIQARIRGNILMALSNKFGWLVLTTGNKSELAVGYCTLYGDMCGGLAVISDVPKTMVYELCRYINDKKQKEIIPVNTINKPPSAELKPGQIDRDSLPPYDILDHILELYIDNKKSFREIHELTAGSKYHLDLEQLNKIINMVNRNEYKRQQAAVGLKVTSQAFGSGWKFPIAVNYRS